MQVYFMQNIHQKQTWKGEKKNQDREVTGGCRRTGMMLGEQKWRFGRTREMVAVSGGIFTGPLFFFELFSWSFYRLTAVRFQEEGKEVKASGFDGSFRSGRTA